MSLTVVDASALAAVAFNEPTAEDVQARLRHALLVAPRLAAYEITNIACCKVRQHPEHTAAIVKALAKVLGEDFAITWVDVELEEVLAVATETQLSGYDASYLWLARRLRAELVTLDRKLEAASAGDNRG